MFLHMTQRTDHGSQLIRDGRFDKNTPPVSRKQTMHLTCPCEELKTMPFSSFPPMQTMLGRNSGVSVLVLSLSNLLHLD